MPKLINGNKTEKRLSFSTLKSGIVNSSINKNSFKMLEIDKD